MFWLPNPTALISWLLNPNPVATAHSANLIYLGKYSSGRIIFFPLLLVWISFWFTKKVIQEYFKFIKITLFIFKIFWLFLWWWCLKGWVQANALRLSRASIYIEDTTTSTCWGSKCLWSQWFSFLLKLWAPPLVAIGTCQTQELHETTRYDTLAWALGWQSGSGPGWQSHKNVTFSPVGHAWLPKWLRPVTCK